MSNLPEFYRQLALLLEAKLPLPASLTELAKGFADPAFQQALTQLGATTAGGQPLATAMAEHPRLFRPLHVKLVAVGERSGALPEVLSVLARMSATEQQFTAQVRETLIYPAITLVVAVSVLAILLFGIVPQFARTLAETFGKEPLPALTLLVVGLSNFVNWAWPVLLVPLVALLVAGAWLLGRSRKAGHYLLIVCCRMLGAGAVVRHWDYAQACQLLGLLLRHRVPLDEALDLVAEVSLQPAMRAALPQWAAGVRAGQPLAELVGDGDSAAGLLSLAFRTQREERLPEALTELAAVYQEQAAAASASFIGWLGVGGLVAMMAGTGFVVMALFLPFFKVISHMGASF